MNSALENGVSGAEQDILVILLWFLVIFKILWLWRQRVLMFLLPFLFVGGGFGLDEGPL